MFKISAALNPPKKENPPGAGVEDVEDYFHTSSPALANGHFQNDMVPRVVYDEGRAKRGTIMPHIEMDDRIFDDARRRASAEGFASVDAYIAAIVLYDLADDAPNLDDLFTPERLAIIDQAAADIDAGNFFTADQARKHLQQKRAAWIEKHGAR